MPHADTHTTTADPQLPKLLLTAAQAAEALGIGRSKLWSLTAGGEIPHLRIGRSVRYSVDGLREWIEQQAAKSLRN